METEVMSNTSRRAILAGAATLPALTVLPVVVAAATASPDTPVMRLFAELKQAWAEWNQLEARAERIKAPVEAGLPPVPSAIRAAELGHPDFARLKSMKPHNAGYIHPRYIEIALEEGGHLPGAEERLRRRLALAEAYHNEKEERLSKAGYDIVCKEMDDNNDISDIEAEIVETPSTCIADVMAKVAVYEHGGDDYQELANSIIDDLKTLFGPAPTIEALS